MLPAPRRASGAPSQPALDRFGYVWRFG